MSIIRLQIVVSNELQTAHIFRGLLRFVAPGDLDCSVDEAEGLSTIGWHYASTEGQHTGAERLKGSTDS